jgi:GT2 family glycosyltransferase
MNNPEVSIVIVNWNGKQYLKDCLRTVFNQKYPDYEMIFVDNASIDGSVEYVKEKFPKAKIIINKENLGFAEGNNIGIRASKGKYVVALNNDTTVEPHWLEELIKAAERDEKIGICASKILWMDKPNIIYSTGFILKYGCVIGDRGHLEEDRNQYEKLQEVFGACACSALYRKDMLNEIGCFDETYFAYHEDSDLSWRAHNAGWKAVYVPTSICYHKSWGTKKDPSILLTAKRNAIRTICKNSSNPSLLIIFALRESFWLIKSSLEYITRRNEIGYKSYLYGLRIILYGLRIIPSEWKRVKKLKSKH